MTPDRVLGVVGTFVLDRIVGLPGRPEPTEGLGGIAYALAAVVAALPPGWRALPIARVGPDALEAVREWMSRYASLDPSAIAEVPEPNNRVELRYHDSASRTERLSGGVGPWPWGELAPRVERCRALLVNFISGQEATVTTVGRLRTSFGGPIYADLHSLFLDTAADGTRIPRALEAWPEWTGCFDAVQMNEDELDLLRGSVEPERVVREVIGTGPRLVVRTLGERGATCWSTSDVLDRLRAVAPRGAATGTERGVTSAIPTGPASELGRSAHAAAHQEASAGDGRVERREIPARTVAGGDPTGCGDVWGGTMFCNLLGGADVERAALAANRSAAHAVEHSGVEGLAERLRARAGRTADDDTTRSEA